MILAGVVGATGQPGGEHAALLYLRGEIAAARAETSSVLARSPADAPTLFVRACLELETTGPDAAAPFVVALERLRPPPPQARVLRQLLARRPDTRRTVDRVGLAVAATDPSNGYLDVAGWLARGGESDPVTVEDVAALEAALGKARFEVPRRSVLERLQSMAEHLDPGSAELRARAATLGTPVPVFRLWQRAESTNDAAMRRRAGLVMTQIASRFACSGTLLERMLASALAVKGAALRDSVEADEPRRAPDALRAWLREVNAANKKLGEWPFAATLRNLDVTREIERYERLAGPMPESQVAGFSCAPAGTTGR